MNQEKINQITERTLLPAMLVFFLPIFLGSIVQQSYNVADALIVGNYAGKAALAAINSTFTIIKLMIFVFIAIAIGGTIPISQYYGAKNEEEVAKTVATLFSFSSLGGLILSVVGVLLAPLLVTIMQVPGDIAAESTLYLRIYFGGTLFSLIYNINSGILRAIGDSRRPFFYLLISSLTNIILDWIFVALFGWGVAGVAIATVISQGLSALLITLHMMKLTSCYRLDLSKLNLSLEKLKEILRVGVPMGVQQALFSIANIFMQRTMNSFGTDAIAAWAIVIKTDFMIWSVMDTMGFTVTTFVAQNLGARKIERMRWSFFHGTMLTTIFVGGISFLLYRHIGSLAPLFNKDPAVIALATVIMRQMVPYSVIFVGTEMISSAIRGTGETFRPMLITLLGVCVFRVLWVIFIVPVNPLLSRVLWAYPFSWIFTTTLFMIYYFRIRMKFTSLGD